ncbi:MAG: hypothetical protein QG610_1847 [Euryarchaeota archaeon]|nr:hypothetical protein [Euryarchaeota archaeon]
MKKRKVEKTGKNKKSKLKFSGRRILKVKKITESKKG